MTPETPALNLGSTFIVKLIPNTNHFHYFLHLNMNFNICPHEKNPRSNDTPLFTFGLTIESLGEAPILSREKK